MAVETRIRGEVGPVKGVYERKGHVPITTRPCEHLVLFDEKSTLRGGGIRVVSFHGDSHGEGRLTYNEV